MILKKFETLIVNSTVTKSVLLLLALILFLSIVFKSFTAIFNIGDIVLSAGPQKNYNLAIILVAYVILAPVIETLLFQALPFLLYERKPWLQKNKWIFIFISGLIFGIGHCYSIYYTIHTFIIGIVLMYAYILRSANDTSFKTVALVHCSWNLLSYIVLQF